jgi:hypothetical protein
MENPSLAGWIAEIENDYMSRFGDLGASVGHLALNGPWHFALVFPGSEESVAYLTGQIKDRASDTEILTMSGIDLDAWRAQRM